MCVCVCACMRASLAKEIGMKILPTTILDLMLGYVSSHYTHYHVLPESQQSGIKMLMEVLEVAAARYRQKHNKIPVLFINGINLLVKNQKELFHSLVTLAKIMANNGQLFWLVARAP